MRIFAFEFFSGGGLAGQPLPATLAREGDLMLTTLAGELAELPGVQVIASRDPRLPPVAGCETLTPMAGEGLLGLFGRGLSAADAAWPTASEARGVLERLARATQDAGRLLLGCDPDAIRLAASKSATSAALREHGIEAVPTFSLREPIPPMPGRWVVKPDDGAGCEETVLVEDSAAAVVRLASEPARLVAQPWIEGDAVSLSLLCAGGRCRLLSCNRQRIEVSAGAVALRAIEVNAVPDTDGRFSRLGKRIAATVPGLWGYVGVDLVLTEHAAIVLEINPRLTTSYCGLRGALGLNTADLILRLLDPAGDALSAAVSPKNAIVSLGLEPAHAT